MTDPLGILLGLLERLLWLAAGYSLAYLVHGRGQW
jgi:hypothetical protein